MGRVLVGIKGQARFIFFLLLQMKNIVSAKLDLSRFAAPEILIFGSFYY